MFDEMTLQNALKIAIYFLFNMRIVTKLHTTSIFEEKVI